MIQDMINSDNNTYRVVLVDPDILLIHLILKTTVEFSSAPNIYHLILIQDIF